MAILLGPDGEVQPDGAIAVLFDQQLVKYLLRLPGIRYHDGCIFYRLLIARCAYIHGTSRQMVTSSRPANLPIQLRTTIPTVNTDGLIIPLAQHLQPHANPLQVCDSLVARNIIHFRIITLCKLPEHKVLTQLCITI